MANANEFVNIIPAGFTLAGLARKAGSYDNRDPRNPAIGQVNDEAVFFLTIEYDTSLPTAGDDVCELFVVPGDGQSAEVFAIGGDGTVGADVEPQDVWSVGVFQSRAPSLTVPEVLAIRADIPPYGSRIVIKNVAGGTIAFGALTKLDARMRRIQRSSLYE